MAGQGRAHDEWRSEDRQEAAADWPRDRSKGRPHLLSAISLNSKPMFAIDMGLQTTPTCRRKRLLKSYSARLDGCLTQCHELLRPGSIGGSSLLDLPSPVRLRLHFKCLQFGHGRPAGVDHFRQFGWGDLQIPGRRFLEFNFSGGICLDTGVQPLPKAIYENEE